MVSVDSEKNNSWFISIDYLHMITPRPDVVLYIHGVVLFSFADIDSFFRGNPLH